MTGLARAVAFAWLWCCARITPGSHRGSWQAQWRADLHHYDRWLEGGGRSALRRASALLGRVSGALPHAVYLRLLACSPAMLAHDLAGATRALARRPAFTAVSVVILALGIGANATMFSWLQKIVLQPLPGVDISRLVALSGTTASRHDLAFSYPNFTDLRAAAPAGLDDMVAFRAAAMSLHAGGEARRVWGELVTPNFFDVLRVTPVAGRGFRAADDRTPVVVVSYGAWHRHFGRDPGIVGRSITVNGRPFTVIGVTPEGFRGSVIGLSLDLFVPLGMQRAFITGDRLAERGNAFLQVFGRLTPDATLEQGRSSVQVAAARLASEHPGYNTGRGIAAAPLWNAGAAGMMLPVMGTLMVVAAIVLLIACANLAGLFLAHAAGRQREVAVRLAVGASRGRLVSQFLAESALLALAGGCAGLLMSRWTSGLLRLLIPPTAFPIAFDTGIGPGVVVYSALVTLVTVLTFGLLPALRGSKPDITATLKDVVPSLAGARPRTRLRSALVVGQLALSLALLVCAALFVRSVTRAQQIDPGFSLRDGVIAALDLLPGGYEAERGAALHQRLLERVTALPGVEEATLASVMPLDLGGGSDMRIAVDGYTPAAGEEVQAYYNRIGPRYFATMGIGIVSGRALDAGDRTGRPLAVVVNETMARKYWRDDPVGRTLAFAGGRAVVVGVARDGKYARLGEVPRNYMYVSLGQVFHHEALLIVRTAGEAAPVIPSLRALVRELDPNLPLFDVRTVSEHLEVSAFVPRIARAILGTLGVLAVALALVGLYSLMALAVTQQSREFGVRIALGATRRDIVRMVLRQGGTLVGLGLSIGILLAVAAAGALRSQLVGVAALDPVSFAVPALLLLSAAGAACAIPALRATTVDPVLALRKE